MSETVLRSGAHIWYNRLTAMIAGVVAAFVFAIGASGVYAQEDQLTAEQQQMLQRFASIQWTKGPTTARIGTMAEIQIPEGYQFASSSDAQTLLELGKLGLLFAKGGKAIILAIVVIFGGLMSVMKRLLGGGETSSS